VNLDWFRGIGNSSDPYTATVEFGQTVVWTITDNSVHNIISVDNFTDLTPNGIFDFGSPTLLRLGDQASFDVNSTSLPSTIYYYCSIHGITGPYAMAGVLDIIFPSATPLPTLSPSYFPSLSYTPSPLPSPSSCFASYNNDDDDGNYYSNKLSHAQNPKQRKGTTINFYFADMLNGVNDD